MLASLGSGLHTALHDVAHWASSLGSHIGALGVAALAVAAAGLLAYAGITIATRPKGDLEEALRPYQLRRPEPSDQAPEGRGVSLRGLARRAADALAEIAERRGLRRRLDERLVRAGLQIGAGEALLGLLVAAVLLGLVGLVLGGPAGLVIGLAIALVVPLGTLQYLAERRRRAFDAQLPDVLKLLAGTLRAGFSLLQGLDAVVGQIKDPMAGEMRQAMIATRLGASVEDALEAAASRLGSRDFSWAVMAIRIQREVGGNLAEILDTVAETMLQRERLRREARTLTAEGRISAWILGVMPFALGILVYVVNRSYISTLFDTFPGQVALVGALILEILGVWWLLRTVKIDV